MSGVSPFWSLLLHPEERGCASKTQSFDDTVTMENKIYPWIALVVKAVAAKNSQEMMLQHSYQEFVKEFRRAAVKIGLGSLVPYQARHSGASIDKLSARRTQLEIKKRGRWKSDASIARYEKAGRLAQVREDLSEDQLRYLELADRHLEELFRGKVSADRVAPPPTKKEGSSTTSSLVRGESARRR
jgi:hypothetical protein